MKYNRPTIESKCKWCGKKYVGVRSQIHSGSRKFCTRSCLGKYMQSKSPGKGRKPSHGGCVGGLSSLYSRWAGIKARCHYPRNNKYPEYGGRGIFMCDEWRNDFKAFESWSKLNGFKPNLQIDRIDNSKGYSPNNCRWVTSKKNCNNRRDNIRLSSGEAIDDVARRLGIGKPALLWRLRNMPESLATALPKVPNGGQRTHFKKHHPEIGKWRGNE